MGTRLGNAKRAKKLAGLFEAWRRAFDAEDERSMKAIRRAIDAIILHGLETSATRDEETSTPLDFL